MTLSNNWKIFNKTGKHRVLITKMLPGRVWLDILLQSDYMVEVNISKEITTKKELINKIGNNCKAVIGQLTENWDLELFQVLRNAGGEVYCNYAVGYDNVNVEAATENHIAICNTPGVLTETTAEMTLALTLACARRIVEADKFMRKGKFNGWLPDLFLGKRLCGKIVGIIGAGRIGSNYGLMMTRAFQMDLIYFDSTKSIELEKEIDSYNDYLKTINCDPVKMKRADSVEEVLQTADVVSLHTPLNEDTYHLITADRLSMMKTDAILINTSRGPIIDEAALAKYCRDNTSFKVGLDVFEDEPFINKNLKKLSNVTITPHIASATGWTREGMARLAALNVKGILENFPAWESDNIDPFLKEQPPKAIPSIVNAELLNDSCINQNNIH